MVVSFANVKPVADAGASTLVLEGETATLDGSASSDANHDTLTYKWSLISKPAGSDAALSNVTAQRATFVPDLPGAYVAQLIVNDGFVDSDAKTVTIQVFGESRLGSLANQERVAACHCRAWQYGAHQCQQCHHPKRVAELEARSKNPNMKNALLNKTNAVLADLQAGDVPAALDKLKNDILPKTDGCATTGSPDKNDWIIDSAAQAKIYPILTEIIAELGMRFLTGEDVAYYK